MLQTIEEIKTKLDLQQLTFSQDIQPTVFRPNDIGLYILVTVNQHSTYAWIIYRISPTDEITLNLCFIKRPQGPHSHQLIFFIT